MKILNKITLAGLALLGLSSISTIKANAQDYMRPAENRATYSRRVYIKHSTESERMTGSVFATMHRMYWKRLYKGERVGVAPFYHMGHDGYVVHVPGSRNIYYVPSNSHSWFGSRPHRSRKPRKRSSHSYVKRTNNRHLLKRSGFDYSDDIIDGNYSPYNYASYLPKHFKLRRGMTWIPFKNNPGLYIEYIYKGNGHWKYVNEGID